MNNSTLPPDAFPEQLKKSEPLRTRTGPRQSKADKKAAKRSRNQTKLLSLLALAEARRQVRDVLQNADRYYWTACSGGSLFLRLDDGSLLQVFSPAYAVHQPTDVLGLSKRRTSYVVNGRIQQQEYHERAGGEIVMSQTFVSGRGDVGSPQRACLVKGERSITGPGQTLVCEPGSIVRQQPSEGAVVITRYEDTPGFMARKFWPLGEDFVRELAPPAVAEDIQAIVGAALAAWSDQ